MENHPTRVHYDNPKMYRWKSWEAQTPFAPSFDVSVWVDSLGKNTADYLERLLISSIEIGEDMRDEQLEMFNRGNFIKDHKWTDYNIFDWGDEVLNSLVEKIYQSYVEYSTELCYDIVPKNKIWIRGWGVLLKPGEFLKHHAHSFHENTFLSGNISLTDIATTTDYYFPYLGWYFGYWQCKNVPGNMTIFPSWLEHRVDRNTTNVNRFSIAFDLFTEQSMEYVGKNRNESSGLQTILLLSKRMDLI